MADSLYRGDGTRLNVGGGGTADSIFTLGFDNIPNASDTERENNPITIIKETMGLTAMFNNWGFIGDSLTSGFLAVPNDEHGVPITRNRNLYPYSWGQIICRMTGANGTNFSVGGLTTETWLDQLPDKTFQFGYNSETKTMGNVKFSEDIKSAYTICLGTNDYNQHATLGDPELDIDVNDYHNNNTSTYAGRYAKIIQLCKELSPSCKIFLITPFLWWSSGAEREGYNAIVRTISQMFPKVYLVDLARHGISAGSFYALGGHCSSIGNIYTAYTLATYIDYIIRENSEDFLLHGAIDTCAEGLDVGQL